MRLDVSVGDGLILCPTGLPAVLEALEREHGLYEHSTYYPVAVAANEDDQTAFVGVAWEYKNIGAYPGANQPTNRLACSGDLLYKECVSSAR
jgi:hypothetical protein